MNFGEKLKKLRVKALLTQDEMAKRLKISHQSISKWENNISLPSIEYLPLIIKILNCTYDDLLS